VPSTLTLTLTNPSALALHGIGFTDVFPAGIEGLFGSERHQQLQRRHGAGDPRRRQDPA
jgi:hypothetical protein